jgi:hypothetical protein
MIFAAAARFVAWLQLFTSDFIKSLTFIFAPLYPAHARASCDECVTTPATPPRRAGCSLGVVVCRRGDPTAQTGNARKHRARWGLSTRGFASMRFMQTMRT